MWRIPIPCVRFWRRWSTTDIRRFRCLERTGNILERITEGDLLWFLKDRNFPQLQLLEDMPVTSVARRRDNQAVKIDESMENLFDKVMNQNFVPVVDDKNVFIGIVTRKDILAYLGRKASAQEAQGA